MKIKEKYKKKPKSESAFYDVAKLKAKKLQWYNLDDVISADPIIAPLIRKYISIFITNLKKNCGKTVWIKNETNNLVKETIKSNVAKENINSRFVLLFRTDTILKSRIAEINNDEAFDYYILGNKIFSKGEKTTRINKVGNEVEVWHNRNVLVGYAFGLNSVDHFTGFQFEGVNKVYYDEYRSKRELSRNQRDSEFKKFYVFLDNVQRNKDDIKIYLFGNNEDDVDPIAEGFWIDKNTDYFIDLEGGIFYLNVDAFKGAEKNTRLTTRLAKYAPTLASYVSENKASDMDKAMIPQNQWPKNEPWCFILIDGIYFELTLYKNNYYIQAVDDFEYKEKKDYYLTYCFLTIDSIENKQAYQLEQDKMIMFSQLYKHDHLFFWSLNDRITWTNMFNQHISKLLVDKNI